MDSLLDNKSQDVRSLNADVDTLEKIFMDIDKHAMSINYGKIDGFRSRHQAYWEVYRESTEHAQEMQRNRKNARSAIEILTLYDSKLTEISEKLPIIEQFIDSTPVGEKHLSHQSMQREISAMEVQYIYLTRKIEQLETDLATKDYLEEFRLVSEQVKQLRDENSALNTTIKNSVNPD